MLQNFLTTLFSTLGGAVGTVIILLTFGKQVVLKGLEVKLKQGADKNIQILSNKLDRKTRAFQLLLCSEINTFLRLRGCADRASEDGAFRRLPRVGRH